MEGCRFRNGHDPELSLLYTSPKTFRWCKVGVSVCASGNCFRVGATQNQSGVERGVWDGGGSSQGRYGSLSEVESINSGITRIEGGEYQDELWPWTASNVWRCCCNRRVAFQYMFHEPKEEI